jgi:hypothetical protein
MVIPSWTDTVKARQLLGYCRATPAPTYVTQVMYYRQSSEFHYYFDGSRKRRLEAIRDAWLTEQTGHHWDKPWTAASADAWLALDKAQTTVDDAIFEATRGMVIPTKQVAVSASSMAGRVESRSAFLNVAPAQQVAA